MSLTKDVWFNNNFFPQSLFKVFSSTDFYDTCHIVNRLFYHKKSITLNKFKAK